MKKLYSVLGCGRPVWVGRCLGWRLQSQITVSDPQACLKADPVGLPVRTRGVPTEDRGTQTRDEGDCRRQVSTQRRDRERRSVEAVPGQEWESEGWPLYVASVTQGQVLEPGNLGLSLHVSGDLWFTEHFVKLDYWLLGQLLP